VPPDDPESDDGEIKLNALSQTTPATFLPMSCPTRFASIKWIPPYKRDIPASAAASEKVFHERVTPVVGSVYDPP